AATSYITTEYAPAGTASSTLPSTPLAMVMATVVLWMPISIAAAVEAGPVTPNARGTAKPIVRLIRQNSSAAQPTAAKYSATFSRSPITAPATSTTSMTTEAMRTGRSIDPANPGALARVSMPSTTGTSTTAKTVAASAKRRLSVPVCSSPKWATARLVISGRVTTASTELMAVSETFSATSPRKSRLYRFAVVPPGEAASSRKPTASTAGSANRCASPTASAGSTTIWQTNAISTARGARATRTKSMTVSVSPSPYITTASMIGRPIDTTAESMTPYPTR